MTTSQQPNSIGALKLIQLFLTTYHGKVLNVEDIFPIYLLGIIWRNSADPIDSIIRRSSVDLEQAARKNPLYRLSTCFCIPESLGPMEAPIASSQ